MGAHRRVHHVHHDVAEVHQRPLAAAAALDAGMAPLEVDAPAVFHTGQRMRLNLEAGTIANLSSGDRQPIRNLTEELLERLRARLGT